MRVVLVAVFLVAPLTSGYAVTEQEVLEDVAERVGDVAATADTAYAVQRLRLTAAVQVADDRRALEGRVARTQLAADLGEAAVVLAASDAAAQGRGQFAAAISQAMGRYQQATSQAHGQWAQECNAAWNMLMQEANASLQQSQQDVNAAIQTAQQTMQSPDLQEMPPIVDGTLPAIEADEVEGDPLGEAETAVAGARSTHMADLDQAFETCSEELEAALAIPAGADVTAALRKAIQKLKITALDRHDQYEAEVRAALRKALLTAIE